MMNRSPDRGSFSIERYNERLLEDPEDEMAKMLLKMYADHKQMQLELEENIEWQKDNLEYDLRTNSVIIEKCKDRVYAQHIYASLCNNEFQRNDVMPILTDKTWSCSWRHAGGIVADIRQEGDYIDWYCSGIRGNDEDVTDQDFNNMTEDEKLHHLETKAFVNESVVTDEVRKDLFNIGWLVKD